MSDYTLTRQSYSAIAQAMKVFEVMPPTQTIIFYLHLPRQGWFIVDVRIGQIVTIRDFEDAGYPIIDDLPSVEIDETSPQDALELHKLFSQMHKDYLVKKSKPTRAKAQLTLVDGDDKKPPLKWGFINF